LLGLIFVGHPVIRILFEHGKYNAADASLTYDVLAPYAVALPAYVGTEVLARGLIALRDTRTPLLTNSLQLIGRAVIMAVLLGSLGVRAIPVAFAVMGAVEMVLLGAVLMVKVQRRVNAPLVVSAPTTV
jgi:putative peptidoglycan lipid II flippase